MLVERKSIVHAEFKADVEKRLITGYASTFDNVDLGGDVVVPGAYTKTLAQDLPVGAIKVKRNHKLLIGLPTHAEQDSKGLLTVSRISKTPLGDETLTLAADRVLTGMSIGYYAEKKSYGEKDGRKVRNLEIVRLSEWSFLDEDPMNPEAMVTGVKSLADVSYALYQMQDALRALQTLSYTPPEIASRLAALMAEMQAITAEAEAEEDDADESESVAAIGDLLSAFRSSLTS